MVPEAELLPGTLDLPILKTVSLAAGHAATERWTRTILAVNTAPRAQEA